MLSWDLVTGHDKIDADHALMLSILNDFFNSNTDQRILLAGEIINYLDDHCDAEELLMKQYCYPDLPKHKIAHTALKEYIKQHVQFLIDFENEKEVAKTMVTMLQTHILRCDKAMAKWIRDNNSVGSTGR